MGAAPYKNCPIGGAPSGGRVIEDEDRGSGWGGERSVHHAY